MLQTFLPSNPVEFIISILVFLVVLSLLVFVHEFGHFWTAKKLGMGVEEFGFGLPPRVWGKKIRGTIYSINWLPIGGFVKLAGEDEVEIPKEDLHNQEKMKKYFWARPKWQRAAVLLAGVSMNFVLAVILLTFIFTQGVPTPSGVVITQVVPDSPAAAAGLMQGDRVMMIDGKGITISDEMTKLVRSQAGSEISIEVSRAGTPLSLKVTPRKDPPAGQGPLGVGLETLVEVKKYPLIQAPYYGLKEALKTTYMIVSELSKLLMRLVTFQSPQVDVGGPVKIFDAVTEARKVSFIALAYLTALLSLNLAIFNVLPIPALDGGRLFFVIFERWIGRAVRPQLEAMVHQVGMVVLLILALLITINDLRTRGQSPAAPSPTPAAVEQLQK